MIGETQVLGELQTLGTEQNRKVFRRHGVGENLFGVSYANLGKLAKRLRRDHALAQRLWATGNHDARVLATMIADPAAADAALCESWVGDLDNYVLGDAVSSYICKSPLAREQMEERVRSAQIWAAYVGWNLLACLALRDEGLPDDYFAAYLPLIERDVHTGHNRVSHGMNNALIAIGMRNARLEELALAAARRIGKVVVDHGQTGCKTPEAAAYIVRAKERVRKQGRAGERSNPLPAEV